MAPKKKRTSAFKPHSQNLSPKARAKSKKLSAAAKRRTRVKGKFGRGKLYANEGPQQLGRLSSDEARRVGQVHHKAVLKDIESAGGDPTSPPALNRAATESRKEVARQANLNLDNAEHRAALDEILPREELAGAAGVTSRLADRNQMMKELRANDPLPSRGSYKDDAFTKEMSRQELIETQMPEAHKQRYKELISAPNSPLRQAIEARSGKDYNEMTVRRLGYKYLDALRNGASDDEAIRIATADTRGRPPKASKKITALEPEYQRYAGRSSKTARQTPTASQLEIGTEAKKVDTINQLSDKMPDASMSDLIDVQQNQRESLADQVLRNQRWAHERKRAQVMGSLGEREGPNRVTIFTTSVGKPEVSVPTDSVIGQYIIRKRKQSLLDQKIVAPRLTRGRFPEAVRDIHVIEASTNRTAGAEGAYGLYKRSGWRIGSKASKNYGKPVPLGSQIMYSSQGAPVYDQFGRVRFTEGATRNFQWIPRKGVGLGVYLG